MRAWILVVLVACAERAPRPAPVAAPTPPAASNRAEAEPWTPPPQKPKKLVAQGPFGAVRNGEILVEEEMRPRRIANAEVVSAKRSDLWHPCVRDVVEERDRAVRDLLGDVLTAYLVSCDRTTGTVVFASRAPASIGISGVVTKTSARLELAVIRRGEVLPQRITILAGGTRWTSIGLDPVYDPVAERSVAALPFTRALARVIRTAIDTDEAIVRFESSATSEDIVISEDMKQDLRVLSELFDALSP